MPWRQRGRVEILEEAKGKLVPDDRVYQKLTGLAKIILNYATSNLARLQQKIMASFEEKQARKAPFHE